MRIVLGILSVLGVLTITGTILIYAKRMLKKEEKNAAKMALLEEKKKWNNKLDEISKQILEAQKFKRKRSLLKRLNKKVLSIYRKLNKINEQLDLLDQEL